MNTNIQKDENEQYKSPGRTGARLLRFFGTDNDTELHLSILLLLQSLYSSMILRSQKWTQTRTEWIQCKSSGRTFHNDTEIWILFTYILINQMSHEGLFHLCSSQFLLQSLSDFRNNTIMLEPPENPHSIHVRRTTPNGVNVTQFNRVEPS